MWKDEIVQEVRKNREAYAAKCNFDLQDMYDDLKKANARKFRSSLRNPFELN